MLPRQLNHGVCTSVSNMPGPSNSKMQVYTSRMKPWNHVFWRGLRWARCPLTFGGWRSTWQCYRRSCIMPRHDITGPRFGRFHWKNLSFWFLGGNIPKSRKNGSFFGPCSHGFVCLLVPPAARHLRLDITSTIFPNFWADHLSSSTPKSR